MAQGYSIPVSVSDAQSQAINPNVSAGVNFNFGTAWYDQEVDQSPDFQTYAEARSSAAVDGNATTAGTSGGIGGSKENNVILWLALGLAAFAAYKSL